MRSSLADAPLAVSTDGTAGPYIIVTTEQMEPVVEALRAQGIHFETDDDAVMLDGRPALSVIDLGHDADVEPVQKILDGLVSEWRGGEADRSPPRQLRNELIVRFSPSDFSELLRRLDSAPPDGWTRSCEIEERMRNRARRKRVHTASPRTLLRSWGTWRSGWSPAGRVKSTRPRLWRQGSQIDGCRPIQSDPG